MFSRFFSNIHFRRVLCCLLALLTFGCCLSPAFVQPAEAVAVADDVLIASLGLLALSWAGITFNTIAGANSGVSRLFQSRPATKLSLAGLLTKKLVVDGTKLLLTSDVRDVFNTVLPDIKSTFPSDAATSPSTDTTYKGSYYSNIPVGVPLNGSDDFFTKENAEIAYKNESGSGLYSYGDFNGCKAYIDDIPVRISTRYYAGFHTEYHFTAYRLDDNSQLFETLNLPQYFLFHVVDGILYAFYPSDGGSRYYWSQRQLPFSSIVIYETPGTATLEYNQSKEVDGTSALEILKPAPLYVVNPDGNEGGDGSSKPEINFKYGMLALEGLIGAITLGGQEAQKDKDPGLKPDEMVNDLQQAMNSAGQNPNPNPNPEPQPNPEPEPAPDPDTPGGEGTPPQFNQMVIPNLKDFFPFCIPGDIKKMIDALCAAPEAPKFTFATSFMGQVYSVNIDLSAWNGVAASVRYMVVAVYIAALAVATRKFIKW